jgi:hypothetical protein
MLVKAWPYPLMAGDGAFLTNLLGANVQGAVASALTAQSATNWLLAGTAAYSNATDFVLASAAPLTNNDSRAVSLPNPANQFAGTFSGDGSMLINVPSRWQSALPLRNAPYTTNCSLGLAMPGNDQSRGGLDGLYDVLAANPGGYAGFANRIPCGLGWTNLQVRILVTTDSADAASFSVGMQACALNTNTLTALIGPGNPVMLAPPQVIANLSSNRFSWMTFNLAWADDWSPRQLWTVFYDASGAGPLTNRVFVADLEAVGY